MDYEFHCPDCAHAFDLKPGDDLECPYCGSTSALPTADAPIDTPEGE